MGGIPGACFWWAGCCPLICINFKFPARGRLPSNLSFNPLNVIEAYSPRVCGGRYPDTLERDQSKWMQQWLAPLPGRLLVGGAEGGGATLLVCASYWGFFRVTLSLQYQTWHIGTLDLTSMSPGHFKPKYVLIDSIMWMWRGSKTKVWRSYEIMNFGGKIWMWLIWALLASSFWWLELKSLAQPIFSIPIPIQLAKPWCFLL